MQCSKVGKAMYHLVVIGALVSALALVGCGGGGGDNGSGNNGSGTTTTSNVANVPDTAVPATATTVQAVLGEQFTFQPGSIFDPSIGSNPATLTFTTPTTASVTSGGTTSSGNTTFGSCTFSFTQGPLSGKSITFTTCSFHVHASNVPVGSGAVNGTLTLVLTGPNGSGTSIAITVQVSILSNGTLVINGVATGITISGTTGTTGAGGTT